MKNFFKKVVIALAILLMLPVFDLQTAKAESFVTNVDSAASLAFDENSGQILYAENADKKVAIGSITKILTLYLVTKAIHQNDLKFTDTIKPTQEQADMTNIDELANVTLETNREYTVKQLYDAAWIVSSNSAAMMLAQKVSGKETDFIKLMRKTIKDWGIKDAEIYNVSGLNNSDLEKGMYLGKSDGENKLSANDIAIIVKHILDEYPEVLKVTSQPSLTFPTSQGDEVYNSLNLLLKGNRDYQEGYEFDGLKTGTTKQAGDSFVGTYPINGTRIVTIVMDAHGATDDQDKRFRVTQNLAHLINDSYKYQTVVKKNHDILVSKKQKYKTYRDVKAWVFSGTNPDAFIYKKSANELGFNVADGKKQANLIIKNVPYGYINYPNVKRPIKKTTPKKTQTSVWDNIANFFKNLF
ncbi:D-alanyl-D-alanine carboxypeptidase family protein [Companilactobacillus zhongbaensis]|uniref:D-alanyl-D-alanine carboxypeptidase family protein n=1 Tax=Companilactobacillus zhongbaensis TaxID=2486009 RepID=UPI000F7893A2|nr:serine hydrolase [Companilactobacillus zhongbaensis]